MSTLSAFRIPWPLLAAAIGLMFALSLTGAPRWRDVEAAAGAIAGAVQAATTSHAPDAPSPIWRGERFAGA